MLYSYLKLTERLLMDIRQVAVNTGDLTDYVNIARRQLAGDSECIRRIGTLAIAAGTSEYAFSSIAIPNASTVGIAGVFNVRMAAYAIGTGQRFFRPRPWEWFNFYVLNDPAPTPGPPEQWAQYGQGSSGSLYVNPPDQAYTLNLDTVCLPADMTTDADPEAIPVPWTDAVPFFATHYALAGRPDDASMKGAEIMLQRYLVLAKAARKYSNPTVNPNIYQGAADYSLPNRLAVQTGGG